jgi:hypothetical protein
VVAALCGRLGRRKWACSGWAFEYGPLRTRVLNRASEPGPEPPASPSHVSCVSPRPGLSLRRRTSSSRLLPPPPRGRLPSPPPPDCCGAEVHPVYPESDRLLHSPVRETPTFLCWMDCSSCLRDSPCDRLESGSSGAARMSEFVGFLRIFWLAERSSTRVVCFPDVWGVF